MTIFRSMFYLSEKNVTWNLKSNGNSGKPDLKPSTQFLKCRKPNFPLFLLFIRKTC